MFESSWWLVVHSMITTVLNYSSPVLAMYVAYEQRSGSWISLPWRGRWVTSGPEGKGRGGWCPSHPVIHRHFWSLGGKGKMLTTTLPIAMVIKFLQSFIPWTKSVFCRGTRVFILRGNVWVFHCLHYTEPDVIWMKISCPTKMCRRIFDCLAANQHVGEHLMKNAALVKAEWSWKT